MPVANVPRRPKRSGDPAPLGKPLPYGVDGGYEKHFNETEKVASCLWKRGHDGAFYGKRYIIYKRAHARYRSP